MLSPSHISTPLLRPSTPEGSGGRARERGIPFTGTSLVAMLQHRASVQPDELAYTFLRDGEVPHVTMTWSELDLRSRAIAALLQKRGLAIGDRALLLYPPGLDFVAAFFGCIYAGVLAVPVLPPQGRTQRGMERLLSIARDAEPACTLTRSDLALPAGSIGSTRPVDGIHDDTRHEAHQEEPLGITGRRIDTDLISGELRDAWRPAAVSRDSLAFLQYTSGSTARPKGVMVSHGNLLHNLSAACDLGDTGPDSVSVSWLPVTHDMGLIEGVLQPAFSGCPAYLISPGAFLQRPVRWLRAISTYRATRSGGPNFAYDLAVARVTPQDRELLDLSRWRAAYNGAEPVRADTMRAFADAYERCGFAASSFRPCYGLAESTLLVTTGTWDQSSGSPVSCGTPAPGLDVRIADPLTQSDCANGEIGEIQVAGDSVTSGYWKRPHETAGSFVRAGNGSHTWLRTGDLGFLRNGRLFVTGRIKDLLIVRGAKHFPQDLERTAELRHPAIRPGAVAAVAVANGVRGDHVALVAEINPRALATADHSRLIDDLRLAIADNHGIQLHGIALVAPGTVPRTTSGKLQRFLCRDAWLAGTLDTIAFWQNAAAGSSRP